MTEPNAFDAKQQKKVKSDIARFKDLVENAEIKDVGKDTAYVPDCPRLQQQMENDA